MLKLSEGLRRTPDRNQNVLLHLSTGQMFTVNSVGSRIVELLETGARRLAIIDQITQECGADAATVRTDVDEFLALLASHKLVSMDDAATNGEDGKTPR
jgi:hypothetical protein